MNFRQHAYLLVFFLFLIAVGTSFAVTFVVNGTGEACTLGSTYYDTIQSAIDGAAGGETIIVCQNGSGEYLENVDINKKINLYGNESGVRVNASSSSDNVFSISVANVNISNFSLSGAYSSSAGIFVDAGGSGCLLSDLILTNNTYGIRLSSSSNNTLINNSAYKNYDGIDLSSGSNNSIINNSAYNNTNFGIYLSSSSNNTISNNYAYNNTKYGIILFSSSNNTISNNYVYNNTDNGIDVSSSSNNTISNNYVYNNTDNGITLFSSSNSNTISNNSAYNNTHSGIVLSSSSNNTISNNSVYNNSLGIYLSSSSNNTISNNSAYNNSFGISLSSSSNNTISNNSAYNNLISGIYLDSSSDNTLAENIAYINSQYGFHLISSFNNTVANNSAYNNSDGGFILDASPENILAGNSAYNNSRGGFGLISSSDNTLTNNIAYNNGGSGFSVSWNSLRNNLVNNTAFDTFISGIFANGFNFFAGANLNEVADNSAYNNSLSGFYIEDGNVNSFTNNSIHNNSLHGVYLESADGNYFTNNSVYDNSQYGFSVFASMDNYFTNNSVYNSVFGGFYLRLSSNNTLIGNSIYSHNYNILLYGANNTLINTHIYNSHGEVIVNAITGNYFVSLSNLTVDNPLGNYENHTVLYIYDELTESESYRINWSTNTIALPLGTQSFNQKFINLSSISGSPLIDQINWTWVESEISGYNESRLELWVYNSSGWHVLNDTPDIFNRVLSVSNLVPSSIYAVLENQAPEQLVVNGSGYPCVLGQGYYPTIQSAIDGAGDGDTIIVCQNGSGAYTEDVLINKQVNLYGNESGVRVVSTQIIKHVFTVNTINANISNFTLSGANHATYSGVLINGGSGNRIFNVVSAGNNYGFYVLASNNTITNCTAYGSSYAYNIAGSGNIVNNSIARDNPSFGIVAQSGGNLTFTNNIAFNSTQAFRTYQSNNVTLVNNTAYNSSGGFNLQESTNITLLNNTAYNNTAGFYLGSSSYINLTNNLAYNNTESGMYFSSSSNNSIINNTAFNNTVYGFRFIGSSGNTIANNTVSQSVNGFYLVFSSENNTLRNNIAYNNTDYGFVSTSDNTTFINNTAYSTYSVGFSLAYSRGIIVNNTAHGNSIGFQIGGGYHNISNNLAYDNNNYGFYLSYSSYNNLTNNTAYNSTSHGLYIHFNSNENRISNCSFYNNSYNIKLSKSSENNSFFNIHLYDASFSDIYAEEDTDISSFYFSNVTIDNPLGNFENYTSLDIYDTLTATESYNLTWHQNSVLLPPERASFANKFISISNESGTSAIDAINWTWLTSELSGYNESNFELWKYNETGWVRLNNSPDTTSNILSFLNVDTVVVEYALLELNDRTAPLASIEYPTNEINLSTNESIELNFTVFDEGSYINSSTCKYYLDGDVTGVAISNCENATFNVSSNIEGRHNISISVKDNSGKQGNSTVINFTIDKFAPNVSILSPSNSYSAFVGTTILVSVNVTDSTTAVSSVIGNLSKDGSQYSTFSLSYSSGLYSYSLADLPRGDYYLSFSANDSANNTNNSEYVSFYITSRPCTDCDIVTKEYVSWSSSTICPENKIKITTEPNTRISLFYRPTITSLSATSNSEGIALFDPVGEGTYSITLSKDGFRTTEGDFSHTDCPPETNSMLISDEVICPENQVKFTVLDDDEITVLEGVRVTFNGQEKQTDSNGQAIFDLLPVNEELEIKAVTIEPIDLSNSLFYLLEASTEGYEDYSSIELIELCPPRNFAVSWAGICQSNKIKITVTDSESGAFVPGAEIESYGTTGEDGTIQIDKIPSTTLNISKLGYIDYSNSFVFAYTCDSEGDDDDDKDKTDENEITEEKQNETKKEDKKITDQPTDSNKKDKEKITTTTNQEQSKTVSSGLISSDTINVLVNDANNVKQQIADYIFESEQGKKTASIAIVIVSVAGVFVYLRFVKKP